MKTRKEQYELDNSWVIWTDGLEYYLDIKPLNKTIFTKNRTVRISEEIFNVVKNGECKVLKLFKKFNLQKFLFTWNKPNYTNRAMNKVNTENKFYGRGFIVFKEEAKYFLEYQLARQGGGSRRFEISKKVYDDARRGNKSTSELLKKHNLYHKDRPENDI